MFIFNDLSIEGQFINAYDFKVAIDIVMKMRNMMRQYGSQLYCHRSIVESQVTRDINLQQAINKWDVDSRRAFILWLTKYGPFWEDQRYHGEDDYLECNEDIVTNSGVGEAAFLCFDKLGGRLVSLSPSSWEHSPISVDWYKNGSNKISIEILNYWEINNLKFGLDTIPVSIDSWDNLRRVANTRCMDLLFSSEAFESLEEYPFMHAQAQLILRQLIVLQNYKSCFDEVGKLTDEGHWIRTNHFMGDRAWFSDSSDTEKSKYEKELSFPKPDEQGAYVFCPWHGKVSSPQGPIRIHFSWPIRADEPLYVVYVGPKLTKH